MKKVFLISAIVVFAFSANAQNSKNAAKPLKFSIGLEAGLPLGDFKEISSFGFGGSVQGEYAVTEKVGITLSAGYLTFSGKTIDLGILGGSVKIPSTSVVPILAGAKVYFAEKIYGQLQAGMTFFNNDLGSAFTYAPGIGVMASENIDICLKYQAASKSGGTLSFLGLRVAYNF